MLSYLPALYQDGAVMRALLQAQGVELDSLRTALAAILEQLYARTATWGLDRWEQELGLPANTVLTQAERRDRIVSKLRGYGTATPEVVKAVAESYGNGDVEIIESFATYTVTVKFIADAGIPSNIVDLHAAVRAVVPAHLAIAYDYLWLIWNLWDGYGLDWDAADALAHDWDTHDTYVG